MIQLLWQLTCCLLLGFVSNVFVIPIAAGWGQRSEVRGIVIFCFGGMHLPEEELESTVPCMTNPISVCAQSIRSRWLVQLVRHAFEI